MIDMVSTTLSCEPICPQLVRRASDHNSGGRKIGRIRCGSMDTVSMPGMKITGATTTVRSAGHGRPVRSPTAATRTVASSRPISAMKVPTLGQFTVRRGLLPRSYTASKNSTVVPSSTFEGTPILPASRTAA